MKKTLKIVLITAISLVALFAAFVIVSNLIVTGQTSSLVISPDDAANSGDFDCILVLGCKVRDDGTPSHMLNDRCVVGSELFLNGASPVLLMSGDHQSDDYNEVAAMQKVAVDEGVPSENILLDDLGLSTYESVYRAKEVFGFNKILIVTQDYHLPRALFIAKQLGLDACGVASNPRSYTNQFFRNVREIFARSKDFIKALVKPEV